MVPAFGLSGKQPVNSSRESFDGIPICRAWRIDRALYSRPRTLIAEAMDEWRIPGLAMTVVQNGEAALVGASGLREVEAVL